MLVDPDQPRVVTPTLVAQFLHFIEEHPVEVGWVH